MVPLFTHVAGRAIVRGGKVSVILLMVHSFVLLHTPEFIVLQVKLASAD